MNGAIVSENIRCVFCGRKPRKNEKFGRGKKDMGLRSVLGRIKNKILRKKSVE